MLCYSKASKKNKTTNSYLIFEPETGVTKAEFTVAPKQNQGTIRKRAVIVFGRLFCFFFGETKKKK